MTFSKCALFHFVMSLSSLNHSGATRVSRLTSSLTLVIVRSPVVILRKKRDRSPCIYNPLRNSLGVMLTTRRNT
ncbi:MAG: hypothetical protein JWR15_197 [Prosthecobacter sp.]|nr:hypothetical protein [Prosthecobacter sp.]